MRIIKLKYCEIAYTSWGCATYVYYGGSQAVDAAPHNTPHYHVVAHRCGYGDDILTYCREHEVAHAFVAEKFRNEPSVVLLALSHGHYPRDKGLALYEEMAAQQMQRWARANERPILSGANWDLLKTEFLALVDNGSTPEEPT